MKSKVIFSLEQALTMTYTTQRFVQLGWRVIKVEPTPVPGLESRGDPNRYIGRPIAGEDRHSYFVAHNVGKEAIAIDLKQQPGQAMLRRLIKELRADVFCTNTLPAHHEKLGIDYETLSRDNQDLIWCCISAMGLKQPDVPGYDPMIQAMCGYMDLTGYRNGPPLQSGLPVIDLKAGDEAFTQIIIALMERSETGKGKKIDISMAQSAVSWLSSFLPMMDMGSPPSELKRAGNEHRQFVPVNAYKTADGYIYIAVGSDVQWHRMTKEPMFASLNQERFATNKGRRKDKVELHRLIENITRQHASEEVSAVLKKAGIPNSPITPIEEVPDLPFVVSTALKTTTPDGKTVRLPPPAVSTSHLEKLEGAIPFAPSYGEHTQSLLEEAGLTASEIAQARDRGVVA